VVLEGAPWAGAERGNIISKASMIGRALAGCIDSV